MHLKFKNPLRGGGINELKPSKSAFTLAEVLITLAIIGIVAALTIPTLVSKNQNKQYYAQFIKMYNTLSNALNLAIVEHGDPTGWTVTKASDYTDKYLLPYLKGAKVCENSGDCILKEVKDLKGDNIGDSLDAVLENSVTISLADGSSLVVSFENAKLLVFDTNGNKGPNITGRDIFTLGYTYSGNNSDELGSCKGKPFCALINLGEGHSISEVCPGTQSPIGGIGDACSRRLLIEGAMNY